MPWRMTASHPLPPPHSPSPAFLPHVPQNAPDSLTASVASSSIGEAAAVEIRVIDLGFVFDLHRHGTPGHGRLEPDNGGALIQGVDKETCQPEGVFSTCPDPPARTAAGQVPLGTALQVPGIFHLKNCTLGP